MPTKGQKLYRIWDNILEEVTFIEESITPNSGATIPTWLVVSEIEGFARRKSRCSVGSYFESKKEAYQKELNEEIDNSN